MHNVLWNYFDFCFLTSFTKLNKTEVLGHRYTMLHDTTY